MPPLAHQPKPITPARLAEHSHKYQDLAWRDYSIAELGDFVHLLVKRSYHRADAEKQAKDLEDAENYLAMIQSHIDSAKAAAIAR